MKFKLMSRIAAMILIMGFAVSVQGQTAAEAVEALKDGAAKAEAKNYLGAIESFKKCIEIYEEIDDAENDNATTAKMQIPNMQYKHAIALYKKKKYDEAIAAFGVLKEYSETYDDAKNLKKAEKTIPKLYYAKGADYLKAKDYENALVALNKSIELDPNYSKSHLRKAQVYEAKDDDANFKTSIDKAVETAKDGKSKATAEKLASNYYLKAGAGAVKAEKYAEAEKHFNTLMEYKSANEDIYYQLAVIYNKQSKWDAAIEASNKALELIGETDMKDAKVYFELGNSYAGKGDNTAACDAYNKANKGDYAAAAEYQIKHVLKCQ